MLYAILDNRNKKFIHGNYAISSDNGAVIGLDGKPVNHFTALINTGFKDANKKSIFDGHVLSDYTQTDEGLKKSSCQVFWSQKCGCWCLDLSFKQNKTYISPLAQELKQFKYHISSHINL